MSANNTNINGWFHTDPSSPYPSTYADLPEDQHDWGCGQWKIYYERNKAIAGQKKAVEIVTIDFDNQGSFSNVYWCKYDCEFMRYLIKEGFAVSNIFTDIACVMSDVTGTAESVTGGISDTTKTLSKLILPAVLVGGSYFLFTFLNKRK